MSNSKQPLISKFFVNSNSNAKKRKELSPILPNTYKKLSSQNSNKNESIDDLLDSKNKKLKISESIPESINTDKKPQKKLVLKKRKNKDNSSEEEYRPNSEEEENYDKNSEEENLKEESFNGISEEEEESFPSYGKKKTKKNQKSKTEQSKKAKQLTSKKSLPIMSNNNNSTLKKSQLMDIPQEQQNNNQVDYDSFEDKTPDWALKENCRDKNGKFPTDFDYDPGSLLIPKEAIKKLTPTMRQYWEIKSNNFDKVVFFKLGKFYEIFYDDAAICNKYLDLNWMSRKMHVGFPEKSLDRYANILVNLGFKVVIVEQTETPKEMEKRLKSC